MKIISKPYNLLLVDDQEEIVSMASDMIHKIYGKEVFNVICATNPKDALTYLEQTSFHILITDIFMPDMPGDELMRKAMNMGKGTQCIVITADSMITTVINAYNDGAIAFIAKPIDKNKLKGALDLCLGRLNYWAKSISLNLAQKRKQEEE
ncbi:MAG: hypothetical protein A2381_09905 [Bdellovibrionales bacterium RIFOXYB1_FULL_37_110]|nr:MAG: hypothetical protein A2181_02985 [Bdellovibrionales bacterium RIFOXYA1_FULL_38_20]OFZ48906.1 MAG: hypothetical protein A2417_08365 [Bdellovibrionales bacterium RIFOXYC1_FULL_37_79]OFZ52699.1 MAG: hypothetical protein A2328_07295 [Bdellovibrionales bacterium RIFOXYB2_FULL_36_6]OFZ59583.1 MAG: hypothetical protein A2381_09905 [Bdellovibrionales bacterium RIFOXYB1_FULL_37_110]OFZ62438.1 MAG: hypothetical protein A2577_03350 [Bdellovibrionales bacterium RIFOXYD1_FULL_36_51]